MAGEGNLLYLFSCFVCGSHWAIIIFLHPAPFTDLSSAGQGLSGFHSLCQEQRQRLCPQRMAWMELKTVFRLSFDIGQTWSHAEL